MPLDTVKTRMQSLSAKTEYKSTLHCFLRIAREEGIRSFWSGSTARLGRLVVSSLISFSNLTTYLTIHSALSLIVTVKNTSNSFPAASEEIESGGCYQSR